MHKIDIHADDYCLSPHTSENILDCIRAEKLDSISVITNMSCFERYARKLKDESIVNPLKLSVHLNFMEGHCLAEKGEVSDLVDERGYFNISWGSLFVWNYSPKKYMRIKKQLKAEIKAQTERFITAFGREQELRFDSHQHTHMIPICYWALLEVIVEQHYQTGYIRITKEPIMPYLKEISLWTSYKPINWIKNLLLNFYALGMERTIEKNKPSWQNTNEPMYLWGVLMSGKMDENRIKKLMPGMTRNAERKGRILEILFHPGTVEGDEMGEEFCNTDANKFYTSTGRHIEYECVLSLQSR